MLAECWAFLCPGYNLHRSCRSLSSSPHGSSRSSAQPSPGRPPLLEIDPPPTATDYCDARLLLLDISNWTSAPVSNALAASLISFYLKIDHPTLGLFDGDLFLDDLIQNRIRYCSPLLVASILLWACVSLHGRTRSYPKLTILL